MALATGDSHSISGKSRGDAAAQRQIYSYLNTLFILCRTQIVIILPIFPDKFDYLGFKE